MAAMAHLAITPPETTGASEAIAATEETAEDLDHPDAPIATANKTHTPRVAATGTANARTDTAAAEMVAAGMVAETETGEATGTATGTEVIEGTTVAMTTALHDGIASFSTTDEVAATDVVAMTVDGTEMRTSLRRTVVAAAQRLPRSASLLPT